jgi:alpha-tubulin suppressor-like RCC1 family protein
LFCCKHALQVVDELPRILVNMKWSSKFQLAGVVASVVWLMAVHAADTPNGCTGAFQVEGGYMHTCAVANDKLALCWGWGQSGQLGTGTQTNSNKPMLVSGLSNVRSISAGTYHTCAVMEDGTARCWGSNAFGQLGTGDTTNSIVPVLVPGLSNVRSITTALYSTCAMLEDGTARCWGYNAFGQLGDGTTTDRRVPVVVSGLANGRSISAAQYHTCAVLDDGAVRCWGYNYYGQLGTGNNAQSNVPVAVVGLSGNALSVDVADTHSCVVLTDATARCWGGNSFGQLGNGAVADIQNVPVEVLGLSSVRVIAAGSAFTCAALMDGTAHCWGNNGFGQLGNGGTTASNTPVAVSGLTNVRSITAGGYQTCAVSEDGFVRCWGDNQKGQLGVGDVGSFFNSRAPTLPALPSPTCRELCQHLAACIVEARLGSSLVLCSF